MKVKNCTLVDMINILDNCAEKRLPQKISYAITRNLILLQKDYNCYIKSLNKLFIDYDKYMVRDENKNIINNDRGIPMVESSVEEEFNEEISTLLNIEVEIEPLYYIPENVFDYEDNVNRYDSLSAIDIMNLQAVLCNQKGSDKNEVSNG